MRFLVDACVDVRVAEWLRSKGHDAIHLRDEGLQSLPNGDIFAKAIAENRTVVTFDMDFSEIAALSRGRIVSVVVLRLHNPRRDHVMNRLASVVPDVSSALASGAIIAIEDSRYRIRRLPIAPAEDAP